MTQGTPALSGRVQGDNVFIVSNLLMYSGQCLRALAVGCYILFSSRPRVSSYYPVRDCQPRPEKVGPSIHTNTPCTDRYTLA